MKHLIFWMLGFSTFWIGLKLFNDEAILIVSALVGSAFILVGLLTSPLPVQIAIEVGLVFALFKMCMECIVRGDPS